MHTSNGRFVLEWTLVALVMFLNPSTSPSAEPIDFNRDIRPILSENCFYCHGQDANKRQADLRLDVRAGAVEVGALVPGDLDASSLIARIESSDVDEQMPPPASNRRLNDAQKQLLRQWVKEGAKYDAHWAFLAPTRPEIPEVQDGQWSRSTIDRFVLSKLEEFAVSPSPEADRATLIKRLAIDLVGLPPSPEQVAAFMSDQAPDAFDRLVDRLLSSPRYGERMALPWLDAARYADSNGFQQDGDTWQWLWRDWVVRAMNDDLPFDEFTTWQLAGDLLPEATVDQKVASGFNRNHLLNGEGGAIAEEQRFVNLFDRVDTTSTTWLGLTMACAQCHDHKYDPITQKDYYRFLDAFNRVPETGTPQRFSARIRVAPPVIELPTAENIARVSDLESRIAASEAAAKIQSDAAYATWSASVLANAASEPPNKPADKPAGDGELFAALPQRAKELLMVAGDQRTGEQVAELQVVLRKHFDETVRATLVAQLPDVPKVEALKKELSEYQGDQIPRVMIMSDAKPRETAILDRGEYLSPTEKVSFAPPSFLPPMPAASPADRLGLAQWLVAPEHPLTSRVQANRAWQHFFGTGIVKTAEDFGVQSEYPLHLALLNWLAVEFREQHWSSKGLHRRIVLSATYRQSSRATSEMLALDSDNRMFARASRFRMPSLLLRDWVLATSGLLQNRSGGAPVYPYQPDAVWEALSITKERDFTYPASTGSDLYRRSLYTFWRRTVSPANMFDAANRQTCRVRLATTSTPLHALTTLNDPSWVEAARVMAEQIMLKSSDVAEQLSEAAQRTLCRSLRQNEAKLLRGAYDKQLAIYRGDEAARTALLGVGQAKSHTSPPAAEHAALTQVCLAIFNLDEALTRE